MSKSIFFIYLLFLVNLQSNIICQIEPIPISIGTSEKIELNQENSFNAYFVLKYDETDLTEEMLIISSNPKNYLSPGYIYASFEEKNPSADTYLFSSQILGKNNVYIKSQKLKEHNQLYINVHSLKESSITLEISLKNKIYISKEEKKVNFKLSDISNIYFSPNEISSKKLLFYALGENINYFNMKLIYVKEDEIIDIKSQQKYENGFGAIINLNDFENVEAGEFYINVLANKNYEEKKVEVGFDFVDEADTNIIDINILEHVHGATESKENCYTIKNVDIQDKKKATMLINAYTQYITFTLKKNETKIYSLDIFNNYFLKLPLNYSEEGNYFCFKKFTPKEKDEEELGPISYDFQIYFDEELQYIQSYLMPLINGKVYIHSINSGDIFIYRYSSFNNLVENNIYSANLLTIRGKPKMYGYLCKTYPECNLDEKKFNELKNNNELDIIRPLSQYIINKQDLSLKNKKLNNLGESIYENREQYLTIVKCETPEDYPNYGECKYSIEINNESDEIQLAPERVFATSLISDENTFLIKVADYQNIKYLNIIFTVLTGNAEIYLVDTENYNKKTVHKKEIITITDNLKEKYILKIKSYEPSFIELKYETDFYFKGYTMMNPNEINIEYVNKENGFMPFEIQNPDYLYPIIDPRNNDFYFTIKSLDCGLTYRYNFNDFNITSIHHEVKKDDINFGTSYAFMLKVEDYFHTAKGDNEDCAVMVYTGEKSENIPLLIISDMPHFSFFNDTYYIYPFIYNSEFDGIFVDIKFEYESLIKLENSPLVEVSFKIGEQKVDFEKYTIIKDSTFFINKEKAKKYCIANLQCSLSIELRKIFGEKETSTSYNVQTNIYNGKKTPEYIFKNKEYNYKILPNGSKYFYTQIDLNEEGEINFMFNKGNSKIFAKIVQKDTIEENHNWNGRIKLPDSSDKNLLNYDSINAVIKYTKEITKNCLKGCELYIQIKSEEKTNKETEFTEVSFNINQKQVNSIEIKLNDYTKGNIEKNEYKYYNIIIPEDYLKISINLYSPYGNAIIKTNNMNDENEWKLIPKNGFGRFIIDSKALKPSKNTLKGISFIIGITNIDNLPEEVTSDNLYYYLQIQGLFNNDKPYYDLSSERNIICDTEDDNYCHVLLYLNHYYNQNKLIYALSLSNSDDINIYANYYISKEIEEISYKNSIQNKFPTNKEHQQTSEGRNILLFDPSKMNEINDYYIFLTIESNKKNNLVKLVLSGNDISQTLLPFNVDRLLLLSNNKIDFFLPNNDISYILNIKSLKGESNIYINKENYTLDKDYYIEFKLNEENYFSINCDNETIILLNNEKKIKDKVYEINMNNTEIYLTLGEDKVYQYSYSNLNNNFDNKEKEIAISMNNIKYKGEKINDDLFDMSAYIINEEILNSLILNPKKEIAEDIIDIKYNKTDKTGIIDISSIQKKDDENNYLFIIIKQNVENKNVYQNVKIQYSIIEKEAKKDEDKNDDNTKYGWIIILIIVILIFITLLIILIIYKKSRLSSSEITEKEVNKMDMPLNEKENDI